MPTRWNRLAGLGCLAVLAAMGAGSMGSTARAEQVYVLEIPNIGGEKNPLTLHLDAVGQTVNAALATGVNARVHPVDASKLRLGDKRLTGEVMVTVQPDNYVPEDGRPRKGRFSLDLRTEGGQVRGTYDGTYGGEARTGQVRGSVSPRPDYGQRFGLKVRLQGALHRLYAAKGPNWKYALDMNLLGRVRDRRVLRPRFETIVPDYRRYSAIVESSDLKLAGNAFTGTFRARVDYGGQGASKHFDEPVEMHVYTLRGQVVGDVVGGTYDVAVGEDYTAAGEPFAGRLDFSPLPKPTRSLASLRLHDAMQEGPVLLNLSLVDDGAINGLAYASGYNHQPHAVDASGLTLDGRRLHGNVTVSIYPDCYKPPEHFKLPYEIDAEIVDDAVTGTFRGDDRGRAVRGRITGTLRGKRTTSPAVTQENLATCELQLGYSLVRGKAPTRDWDKYPMNHANVRFTCEGGEIRDVAVYNPHRTETFRATVVESGLDIDGDRLTGRVAFDLSSEAVEDGRYVFRFDAILDGENVVGYWRGTHNGKDILTKSAKLGGSVQARDE